VRVNLIRSILVFQEKKYCLHDNVKLVFFKKYIQKLYTLKKKITRTVQVNLHCLRAQCKWIALCTRIQNLKKQPWAASSMSRLKRELPWILPVIFSIFDIIKHYICCDCFKHRSNHANKRSLSQSKHCEMVFARRVWQLTVRGGWRGGWLAMSEQLARACTVHLYSTSVPLDLE
jgi:hypothetical protein